MARFEARGRRRALERHGQRRIVTARSLGITRECLYKMEAHSSTTRTRRTMASGSQKSEERQDDNDNARPNDLWVRIPVRGPTRFAESHVPSAGLLPSYSSSCPRLRSRSSPARIALLSSLAYISTGTRLGD